MAEWGGFCPVCGKNNNAQETEQIPEQELPKNDQVEETEGEYEPSPKVKKMKRNMAMAACFALLAVLATVLFFGIRSDGDMSKWFGWMVPKANNIQCKDSFTVSDKKVVKKGDVVVATLGDAQLTNTQLQFYYWTEVYDFFGENYYYLSYLGLDYTKPLDEQVCQLEQTMTWQQYFLQNALDAWHGNMAMVLEAKKYNFQLPEEARKELEEMPATLATTAKQNGYDSVDQLVQDSFGPGTTMADYLEFMETQYMGNLYFAELYGKVKPTMEELNAYFLDNKETLEQQGIKQDGSYTVDVRHILVHIDTIVAEMEETVDSTTEITDAHWEACRAAAQKIYDEFLNGDKSETLFGELANKHSDDQGGKVTNGGIYTFVKKGEMVAEFDAWCFDEARKPGDTGLVKTKFGYHVMYFVGSEETWITGTRSAYMTEKSNQIVTEALEQYEVEINYKKIVLSFVSLQ